MRHSKTPITYSDVVHEYKCDSCDQIFSQGKPYYRHILITHYGMMEKNLPAVLVTDPKTRGQNENLKRLENSRRGKD